MPTNAQQKESREPPPFSLGADTLEAERFPPGQRPQEQAGPESESRASEANEAELLGIMARQHEDPSAAREAWAELHTRHSRYIAVVARNAFGSRLATNDRVSDAVADTLQAAFDWSGKQNSPEQLAARFSFQDPEAARRKVLGWLAVITRRIAGRRIIGEGDRPLQLQRDVELPQAETDPPPSALHSLLRGALQKLSPMELEALQVSLPWYEPETGEFAFPRGEAQNVAKALGISSDTLRQRRHRGVKRLKALLQTSEASEGSQ